MKTRVTVLMAAFNGEKYIEKQLDSIINQSLPPYKIIINIDKSEDDTLVIVNNFKKKYSNIEIINSGEIFGSAAANFINSILLLDLSNSEFLALADQDDIWKKDKLQRAVSLLRNDFDCYSSNVQAFWENGKSKIIYKNQNQKKYDFFFESAGPGCSFVLKNNFVADLIKYLKSGDFDNFTNYHDWLIYAYARSKGYKWFIDSYPSLFYRQHNDNLFGANIGFKAFFLRVWKVLNGDGFDFAFLLLRKLAKKDKFIQSLFPLNRFSFLKLALKATCCRRKKFDQILFFCACLIMFVLFPKKIINS